jgi:hypothetical protein
MSENLRIVWGARAIGEVIGRTERQTHYLLEQGAIRAARKIGFQWCASVPGLHGSFATRLPSAITPPESKNGQHLPVLADLLVRGGGSRSWAPTGRITSPVRLRASPPPRATYCTNTVAPLILECN